MFEKLKQEQLIWKELTCKFCGAHLGYVQIRGDLINGCCKKCF